MTQNRDHSWDLYQGNCQKQVDNGLASFYGGEDMIQEAQ